MNARKAGKSFCIHMLVKTDMGPDIHSPQSQYLVIMYSVHKSAEQMMIDIIR